MPTEPAEILLDQVQRMADWRQDLVQPGSVFYWDAGAGEYRPSPLEYDGSQFRVVGGGGISHYGFEADPSNYERIRINSDGAGVVTIAAESAGIGADDINLELRSQGNGVINAANTFRTANGRLDIESSGGEAVLKGRVQRLGFATTDSGGIDSVRTRFRLLGDLDLVTAEFLNLSVLSVNASSPDPGALLQIDSTTQGFLPPRMTTAQRDAITSPPVGLTIFNTTTDQLEVNKSTGWAAA